LKTDHDGFPIAFELTGGEAADSPMFEALIDAGPNETPRAVVCDKGYDSDENRALARERGTVPVIPHRSNRKKIPAHFAKALYRDRGRARIEQMIGKLKRFKRVALRCEKTARNFRSIVALAAAFILLKSVHTA
jgi:IS5 family transposase